MESVGTDAFRSKFVTGLWFMKRTLSLAKEPSNWDIELWPSMSISNFGSCETTLMLLMELNRASISFRFTNALKDASNGPESLLLVAQSLSRFTNVLTSPRLAIKLKLTSRSTSVVSFRKASGNSVSEFDDRFKLRSAWNFSKYAGTELSMLLANFRLTIPLSFHRSAWSSCSRRLFETSSIDSRTAIERPGGNLHASLVVYLISRSCVQLMTKSLGKSSRRFRGEIQGNDFGRTLVQSNGYGDKVATGEVDVVESLHLVEARIAFQTRVAAHLGR